jgi:uncharacterized protein involved in exopolysaccharide biosynthesis
MNDAVSRSYTSLVVDTSLLLDLLAARWRWMVASFAVSMTLGLVLSQTLPQKYVSVVTIIPAEAQQSRGALSDLAGLASVAGFSVGSTTTAKLAAVLESDMMLKRLAEKCNLSLVTLKRADQLDVGRLSNLCSSNDADNKIYDWRDSVKLIRDEVVGFDVDEKSGIIDVRIRLLNADAAATVANTYIDLVDQYLRNEALAEAEAKLNILNLQLTANNLDAIDKAIATAIETELQKIVLIKARPKFAFDIIDRAYPAKVAAYPNLYLFLLAGVAFWSVIWIIYFMMSAFYRAA